MNHRFHSLQFAIKPVLTAFLLVLFGASAPLSGMAAGTWATLANAAPGTVSLMLLLSDGTVMCQNSGNTGWYRLTPDIHGSYVNGTWTALAPMNYSRRYYSSQVLRNGQVFVAGGEYGSGGPYAEVYDPVANVWTVTPNAPGVDNFIDSISETLPNGNVLIAPVTPVTYGGTVIWNATNSTWSTGPTLYRGDDQDEAAWVKLPDTSILTIDPFGTNSERYIPSLNQWINDANVPVVMYGYGGELGAGFLLPNGNAFYIGGTNHTAIYTPTGTTSPGVWTAGAAIPNNLAAVDAPGAMMVNGNVLCALGPDTGYLSPTYFYEYNYISNSFALVSSPTGGTSDDVVPYGCSFLDLPDGTVLFSGNGSQLYDYQPSGPPVTNGMPTIISATTNLDGSLLVTGTLLNGISEGAAYGDDEQMASDYPVARITNSSGNTLYCRTYNWSIYNPMTGTNVVSTEMTLPAGLLAGTYPLCVTANGISSAPYSLTISGTPLPAVTGLAFTTIASNKMVLAWNAIGLTETGYVVQRATNGLNYSTVATIATNNGATYSYTDNAVTPLGQYYYKVLGTNFVGLGHAAPAIFAASSPVVTAPVPWSAQDVGAVQGSGASGTNNGGFTVIGSGAGMGATNDQFQFVYQPVIGDVTITARVLINPNTGNNALAGVMLRASAGFDVADALMGFSGGSQASIFENRSHAGGTATHTSQSASAPLWVRLVRSGNTITGYTSTDGNTWAQQGMTTMVMSPTVLVGLAVTSGTANLLNTSTFDNVAVTGTAATTPPPMAEWKMNETTGTTAEDSIDSFNGTYNGVVLGQPGATPSIVYSAGFNGTNANVSIPPLNLNSNVVTITAWINPNGTPSASCGIFFDRESATANGLTYDNATANELSYTWNNSSSTYNWHSGLIVPVNRWTFVALAIEPTRARIYMATNGVLVGATNAVANPAQGFAGNSCIGQDTTSSSRYFNGLVDDVRFYNQALTPTQISGLATQPVISFASPANGSYFTPPANVSLVAALSATNGQVLNLVQYFSGGTLIGQSASAPAFAATATNLAAGRYTLTARLFYDSGNVVDSAPVGIVVVPTPAVPQNVAATALASSSVFVSWSPAANATGYILSQNGTPITSLSGISYLVTGLASGSDDCFSVVATNPVGSSAASASSCVTTPVTGTMLTWDAGSSPVGPQDGNDFWGSGAATWWNGSVNIVWTDDNLAVIGNGTATNCIVSLTNNVTPSGLIFSANNGGSYTVTNAGGNLVLSGTPTVAACNNATIGTVIQGAGALVKSGSSNLTLSGTNTYSGGTTIAEGTLTLGNAAAIGKNGSYANGFTLENGTFDVNGQANYITANLGAVGKTWLINAEAITLGGESGGVMTIQDSGGTGSGFSLYNLQNCIIYNATGNPGPATISAPWLGDGQSGAGIIKTINVGQSTNSGGVELDFTGQLGQNSGNDGANTTIQKTGAGTMRISAANYFPYVRVTAGTLIVNNAAALGTTRTQNGTANNLVTVDGGTLDLNGFSPSIGSLTNGGVTTGVILNNGASGSTLTVGAANTSTIFAGSIKDGASTTALAKSGTGTLTLSGANTFSDVIAINAGTLAIAGAGELGGGSYAANITDNGSLIYNSSAAQTLAGVISGSGTLTQQGAGVLTLSGANTFSGSTSITAGALTIGGAGQLGGGSYAATIADNGSLIYNSSAAQTLAGVVSGSGTLVQLGGGTLTLSGGNTYTGTTTVSNGTLMVNGSLAAGSVVTVATNAVLAGNGIIYGPVTIRTGGTLQPGPGGTNLATLTISNSLNLSGKVLFALNKTNMPVASQIAGLSSVNYGGALVVTNLGPATLAAGDSFVLFSAGSYSGAFNSETLPALATNLAWDVSQLAVNGGIFVAALPVITNQPQSLAVNLGSPAAFSVGATGNATLAYQWLKNGTNLPGATTDSYSLASAMAGDAAGYSVVVTNNYGSVTSLVAMLTINLTPELTSVGMLGNGTFSLSATGGAGQTFVLLGASNLAPPVGWWPLATNTAGTNGVINFSDPQATNFSQRFYRLLTP